MPGTSQPVRFYKIVALTFLFITIVLLGLIVFMSSKRATITILTKPEPVEKTFTIDLVNGTSNNVWAAVTSTEISLEKTFNPKGTRQEEGIAKGEVTLYNDSATVQPLVATTRLLTADGILMRLKNSVVVPAKGIIKTEVYADQKGAGGNIGPSEFSIPGLGEGRRKEVYAKSESAMTGGIAYIGILDAKDVAQAETAVKQYLEEKAKIELQKMYPDKTMVFKVTDTNITSNAEVGKEAAEFVVKGIAKVSVVFYDDMALGAYAEENLKKQIVDSNEIVHKSESLPKASVESVDAATGKATLNVSYSGLVSLDPNTKDLQRMVFYGKSEEEVRRYVLSLDHVSGVEVKFKPIWNKSVPYVADHVNIVVRQVE